jgi:hypothetical protein
MDKIVRDNVQARLQHGSEICADMTLTQDCRLTYIGTSLQTLPISGSKLWVSGRSIDYSSGMLLYLRSLH